MTENKSCAVMLSIVSRNLCKHIGCFLREALLTSHTWENHTLSKTIIRLVNWKIPWYQTFGPCIVKSAYIDRQFHFPASFHLLPKRQFSKCNFGRSIWLLSNFEGHLTSVSQDTWPLSLLSWANTAINPNSLLRQYLGSALSHSVNLM